MRLCRRYIVTLILVHIVAAHSSTVVRNSSLITIRVGGSPAKEGERRLRWTKTAQNLCQVDFGEETLSIELM